ncbi:hypothetical protein ALC60_02907 [Trachymyrmex zeteki]|uniref:Uncharacterized protein n=1 Tax=Mycetomoellerius zeteki TaxID=64791 RepID=A0A151XCL4_9HYME|nr:hypothetical protein ALC60_02907 [Trachymyrmex zeteki]
MTLDRHFKPIIKPLRQIVNSSGVRAIKRESRDDDVASAPKREKKEEEEEEEEEASETFERSATLRKSDDRPNFDVDDADNIIIDGKHVIAPLMSIAPKKQKKSGKGLPHAITLNDNAIDYVYWDDPNELVHRLRLLDASHRAGNNAHDEILSILEELRETGLN